MMRRLKLRVHLEPNKDYSGVLSEKQIPQKTACGDRTYMGGLKIHDFYDQSGSVPACCLFMYGFASLQKCKFVVLNKQSIQYLVNMIRGLGVVF